VVVSKWLATASTRTVSGNGGRAKAFSIGHRVWERNLEFRIAECEFKIKESGVRIQKKNNQNQVPYNHWLLDSLI
jgi:hypothetical protein